MIFKRKSKMFWVEAFLYLVIIIMCMLGSFGVFDAKAQEGLSADICESWIELPHASRIMFLRYGIITELQKSNLEEGKTNSLIECLGEYKNLKDLDETLVNECRKSEEKNIAGVFEGSLKRMIFRCLKWVNGEKE
jgi:hypothetical protein